MEGINFRHVAMLFKKLRADKQLEGLQSVKVQRVLRQDAHKQEFSFLMRSPKKDLDSIVLGVTIEIQ